MRIAFALPGLHRVARGAERAFESIAGVLARAPDLAITVFGSGQTRANTAYRFVHVGCAPREHFERVPSLPLLRDETAAEELTFACALLRSYRPADYDVTVACSYPYVNWVLRVRRARGTRPAHVFVTQNGDWAPQAVNREFRLFGCDGLVCVTSEHYERNRQRWFSTLIPHAVDTALFCPGPPDRALFGIPPHCAVVLMVSALIPSKRVLAAIRCVAAIPDVHLVIAGDGPQRHQVERAGAALLPGHFQHLTLPPERMPDLYRCADVLLHTSMTEPWCNTHVEALATGLPVVAHRHPAAEWILAQEAILVDASDESAVRDGIVGAVRAHTPDAARRRRAVIEAHCSIEAMARAYRDFFAAVVERQGRGYGAQRGTVATKMYPDRHQPGR